jgi:MFS transporter, ACDE family, multidrug resistance protein
VDEHDAEVAHGVQNGESAVSDNPAEASGSGSRVVLAVLLLGSTLGVMGGATIVPVLELIRTDLGVSGTASGFIITAHGLAIAVTSPIIGRLIDRFGVRIPMVAGLAVYGIAGAAGLVLESFPVLVASRLVFGVGAAAVFSCTTVALLALYQGSVRDRVMGWRSTATSLGGLAWPLLGGVLGGISWHAAFGVYLIGVPLALAALAEMPNVSRASEHGGRIGFTELLRRKPALLAYYALLVLMAIMMYVVAVFLPQRLAEIGITSPLLVSIYAVVGGAAVSSVVGLYYARLRQRVTYTVLLRAVACAWVLAYVVYGTVSQPVLLLLAPALLGAANGIMFPLATVLIDEAAGNDLRAKAAALMSTAIFAGQFASPLLLGPVIAATSTTGGFLAAAGIGAAILAVLLAVRIPEQRPAAEPTSS